jgi:hypothetical protein
MDANEFSSPSKSNLLVSGVISGVISSEEADVCSSIVVLRGERVNMPGTTCPHHEN